jgi:hypothetical protein
MIPASSVDHLVIHETVEPLVRTNRELLTFVAFFRVTIDKEVVVLVGYPFLGPREMLVPPAAYFLVPYENLAESRRSQYG